MHRAPRCEPRDGRLEAAVAEHGRVDAAGEVAELLERLARAAPCLGQELPRGPGSVPSFCSAMPRLMPSATRLACAPS